ncbi:hypothetical protein AB205_0186980, partial [Aquarana catesbeiana]
ETSLNRCSRLSCSASQDLASYYQLYVCNSRYERFYPSGLGPFAKRHARSSWLVFLFAVKRLFGDDLGNSSNEFLVEKVPLCHLRKGVNIFNFNMLLLQCQGHQPPGSHDGLRRAPVRSSGGKTSAVLKVLAGRVSRQMGDFLNNSRVQTRVPNVLVSLFSQIKRSQGSREKEVSLSNIRPSFV